MLQIIGSVILIFIILALIASFPRLFGCLLIAIILFFIIGFLWRIGVLPFIFRIIMGIIRFIVKEVVKIVAKFKEDDASVENAFEIDFDFMLIL